MATKREFLKARGLAKGERGRFSAKALEALAQAEADGVVFDEVKPETPVATFPSSP